MNVEEILTEANKSGVLIYLEDNRLAFVEKNGTLTDELKSKLKKSKNQVIEYLKKIQLYEQNEMLVDEIQSVPRSSSEKIPLSFAQQRLWFITKLEGPNATYHIPEIIKLKGNLSVTSLQRSLKTIISRHEILRTVFYEEDAKPWQKTDNDNNFVLTFKNLEKLSAQIQRKELAEEIETELTTLFDLSTGPLLRGLLLRLSDNEHVLLVTLHHIIFDAWSSTLLIKELNQLYNAFCIGQENPLPPLNLQYADYTVWQRRYLTAEVLLDKEAYWKKHLADIPSLLELPTDRSRPTVQSYRGDSVKFTIEQTLSDQLKTLAKSAGLTLYMVLYSAWALLLSKLSGQDQVVIGTPVANRQRHELENLIGFFINTLALRADLSGEPSVSEFLQKVKTLTLGAYAHQEVPFERVVELIQPTRNRSHSPVFQTFLDFSHASENILNLYDLQLEILDTGTQVTKFDLTLSLLENKTGIDGRLEYASDLFYQPTIERWVSYFKNLLQELVKNQQQPVSCLSFIPVAERQALIFTANQTQVKQTSFLVHELFEQQFECQPEVPAAICGKAQLSYEQLNQQANQLAHELISLGVQVDTLVGVYMSRSLDMVVAILGILKAGGAYVPLEPGLPQARLDYIVNDAKLAIVLTQKALKESVPNGLQHTLCLDANDVKKQLIQQPDRNLRRYTTNLNNNNLVYVIYTSGSTGKPKGVELMHSSVVNYLLHAQENYFFETAGAVVSTALSFDATVTSLLGPLTVGKTIHLIEQGEHEPEFAALKTLLTDSKEPLVFKITPAHLQALQAGFSDGCISELPHCLVIGGEQLTKSLLSNWQQQYLPNGLFINEYGPTETVVGCSIYIISDRKKLTDECVPAAAVPIGQPIRNTQLYVVDKHLHIAPKGVVGELLIGGTGLARGYLNSKELTAEKFISNPFSNDSDSRLYRSGDLVRYLSDDNLEFVGRMDEQVKLRGFRIELGEIESQIAAYPEVNEVAVLLRGNDKDTEDGGQLITYIGVPDGNNFNLELMRKKLQEQLPDYMLPSQILVMPTLPLTINGKIDRKALLNLEIKTSGLDYQTPRGETEKILADIWCDLLKLEQVDRRDNFYEMGGHSLLAIRLIGSVQQQLGRQLNISTVFDHPVLSELASQLDAAHFVTQAPMAQADRSQVFPLSWSQQRLWFIAQLEGANAAYHIPGALRLSGNLSISTLQKTFSTIIYRHEVLRTVFQEQDGEAQQVVNDHYQFELLQRDLSHLTDEEQRQALQSESEAEASVAFDLSESPLLRVGLLRLSDTEHVLLVTMHHIIADGLSMTVLINEVNALYRAYLAGEENPLPPLAIQYADYAVWQRRHFTEEVLEKQENYWQQQLSELPSLLELPTDRVRPVVQSYRGDSVAVELDLDLSERVKELAKAEGLTLHMLLYTAWVVVLSRLSGQDQIVVGTPVANRQRQELENLIGFFVNTLALRADLSGEPTVKALLARVKAMTLAGYAHQDVPFERIVEVLQPQRSMSFSPIFQVLFNLDQADTNRLELPELQLEEMEVGFSMTPFDLSLALSDSETGITGWMEFATDLFDRETIESWVVYFKRIVTGFVSGSENTIQSLDMLTESETKRLLTLATGEPVEIHNALIHKQFECQAELNPKAIAAEQGGVQLSYDELNQQANQLAHYLIKQGYQNSELIGIYLPRSLDFLIAMLAIMKAGSAYVVLDNRNPIERLQKIKALSQLQTIITNQSLAETFCTESLCLDEWSIKESLSLQLDSNPDVIIPEESPAFVYFTSGSTGIPKGAVNSHRGVVNNMLAMAGELKLTSTDRVLQFAALGFDVVIEEVFPAWFAGATVVLRDEEGLLSSDQFQSLLSRNTITVCELMADYWSHWVTYLHEQGLSPPASIRTIILGSRVVLSAYQQWQRFDIPIVNVFGLTEVGCTSLVYHAQGKQPYENYLPNGRPLANTKVYVMDHSGHLAPEGVIGELYLAGVGVALGYLGEAELNAKCFSKNPFNSSERLYKTGDSVRWLADGNLEFAGRQDHQVKIRGFRVELGEIESKLAGIENVAEAVVIVHERNEHNQQLIAYVTFYEMNSNSIKKLRERLKTLLPEYMLPSVFIPLQTMPLTINGKVDRKALPEPDDGCFSTGEYIAPVSNTEIILAEIWQDLLGLEKISRYDSFFELGGHSLLAIRLSAAVQNRVRRELGIRDLFEHPVLSDMAELLDASNRASREPIIPTDHSKHLPLSWSQERLWFIAQFEGANAAYHLPETLCLKGKLSLSSLENTFNTIVSRHGILRTVFREIDGSVRQIIQSEGKFALEYSDYTSLAADDQRNVIDEVSENDANKAFDLNEGPLIRGHLLALSEDKHILLVTMHHIISDGWSMMVLINEINSLYQAYSNGESNPLPPLEIQYADYAVWQREKLTEEALANQESYWQKQLQGIPSMLTLPTDRARPTVQSYQGDSIGYSMDENLNHRLKTLANAEGLTLHMVLYSAWVVLLSRLSGQQQIVVGTPVANRQQYELENLIGFFVNTLPLSADLSDDLSIKELLAQVKELTLAAYAHQDVPFERIVEIIQPERSMSYSPLFQVLFNFEQNDVQKLELPGLKIEEVDTSTCTTQFDLILSLVESDSTIVGELKFATDLFDHETVERWLVYFKHILEGFVAQPDASIHDVDILPPDERESLLAEYLMPETNFPVNELIHQRFEIQAEKNPQAVALVHQDNSLSYGELNEKANQLAHYLIAQGVKPETLVGLYMERSLEAIIAILAILKAGGAYVPMDPVYPTERLSYQIEDAKLDLVLTQQSLLDDISFAENIALCIDDKILQKHLINQCAENPDYVALGLNPGHLAYVIYTSGSTGKPKGVLVEHSNVIRLFEATDKTYEFNAQDVWPLFHSLAFDFSVWEVWGALFYGGSLIIVPRETARSAAAFYSLVEQQGVTVLSQTPSAFKQFIEIDKARGNAVANLKLRYISVGGEAYSLQMFQPWVEKYGDESPQLMNVYGITETTVFVTYRRLFRDEIFAGDNDGMIGGPLADLSLMLLTAKGQQLVPNGVTAEIYVGGAGLTRGYLNRCELTEERFVAHPFIAGERLYGSGDLARYDHNGELIYMGRNDHQVKLRGFRIELGEIESQLRSHPAINEAIVMLHKAVAGDGKLVAYVTSIDETDLSIDDLRACLLECLPEYMVPRSFVFLDQMPLTVNGKINRKALPEPDPDSLVQREYVEPVGETEIFLSEIWQELLKSKRISRIDNFFELGGHSILITQLINAIKLKFAVSVPLSILYEKSDFADMAKLIDTYLYKNSLKAGISNEEAELEKGFI